MIEKYDIRNPDGNTPVSQPVPFNLMFKTTVGPSSASPGYLRPETAQGQFLNFKKLLDYNQNSMPFASASIGKSFRNEISPRSGLLRVREFLMAEIEHFVDPEGGKRHPKFDLVKDLQLSFLDRATQLGGKTSLHKTTIGEAVASRMVDNETLGYFLGRIYLFLLKIGVDANKVRFRQHMANEMAHYATDCWDAELQTTYGWIECVGCADRSAYDLTVHSKKTEEPLVVRESWREPLKVEEWQIDINKPKLGPLFKKNAKAVEAALSSLSQSERESLATTLEENGIVSVTVPEMAEQVEISKDLISIVKRTRTENIREYIPIVIEPSFGIRRIFYSLLEHVTGIGLTILRVVSVTPASNFCWTISVQFNLYELMCYIRFYPFPSRWHPQKFSSSRSPLIKTSFPLQRKSQRIFVDWEYPVELMSPPQV